MEFDTGGCGRRARTLWGLFIGTSFYAGNSSCADLVQAVALTPLSERDLLRIRVRLCSARVRSVGDDLCHYQLLRGVR
jgi:hypothetical protein